MGKHKVEGIYGHMKFPDYQFNMYPKHVHLADGTYRIANNQREELEIISNNEVAPEKADPLRDENLQLQKGIMDQNALIAKLNKELAQLKGHKIIDQPEGRPDVDNVKPRPEPKLVHPGEAPRQKVELNFVEPQISRPETSNETKPVEKLKFTDPEGVEPAEVGYAAQGTKSIAKPPPASSMPKMTEDSQAVLDAAKARIAEAKRKKLAEAAAKEEAE